MAEVAFIWIVGCMCVARKKNGETVNSEMEDSTGLHMMILILDHSPPPPPPPPTFLSVKFIFDVTATLFRLFLFFRPVSNVPIEPVYMGRQRHAVVAVVSSAQHEHLRQQRARYHRQRPHGTNPPPDRHRSSQ